MNKTSKGPSLSHYFLYAGALGFILSVIALMCKPSVSSVKSSMLKDSVFVARFSDTLQKEGAKKRKADSTLVAQQIQELKWRVKNLEAMHAKKVKNVPSQSQKTPQRQPRNVPAANKNKSTKASNTVSNKQKAGAIKSKPKPFNCKDAVADLQKQIKQMDSRWNSRFDSLQAKTH